MNVKTTAPVTTPVSTLRGRTPVAVTLDMFSVVRTPAPVLVHNVFFLKEYFIFKAFFEV